LEQEGENNKRITPSTAILRRKNFCPLILEQDVRTWHILHRWQKVEKSQARRS
jgi:hypothetical protein